MKTLMAAEASIIYSQIFIPISQFRLLFAEDVLFPWRLRRAAEDIASRVLNLRATWFVLSND